MAVWAAAVFVLVIVGGGTRLTESGLSITEWKPLSGVIPPIGDAAWNAEFEKYKQIPQYAKMNAGMTVEQFKGIFWWEFIHRFWARFAGMVFAIPFFWFWLRRRIPRELMPRIVTIGVLLIAQAALGWYMVASGLVGRVNVSQYRLAAHLSLALLLYLLSVWTADQLLNDKGEYTVDGGRSSVDGRARRWLRALLGLVAVTVVSGAFVAGLRAGKMYNEFPFMGAGLVPAEYSAMSPWWKNWFENGAAAQFDHRLLAIVTLVAVVACWTALRHDASDRLRQRLNLVLAAAAVQVALGITVLLLAVPVAIGVAHQAGAVLVLTAVTLALREASAA